MTTEDERRENLVILGKMLKKEIAAVEAANEVGYFGDIMSLVKRILNSRVRALTWAINELSKPEAEEGTGLR